MKASKNRRERTEKAALFFCFSALKNRISTKNEAVATLSKVLNASLTPNPKFP
ncbi:hypothetical protein [Abditibacterium utsteinense]|uniref:hypothetical protein n=1 Tax=Abditibacterium utsteinense TaxID=1960156 RepID=UPI001300B898|nr:hypothetical protein [Abditibacterium utsteinense]